MTTSSTASALILAIILLLVAPLSPGNCASTGEGNALFFSFGGSGKNRSFATEFALYGDAEMNSSEVRVTRAANESSGLMIYWKPVRFFGTKLGFFPSDLGSVIDGPEIYEIYKLITFSAYISSCLPLHQHQNVHSSIAVFDSKREQISPRTAMNNTSMTLVNIAIVVYSFQLGIITEYIMASQTSVRKLWILFDDGLLLILSRGEKLHSWIDYDGESKRIEVRLCQDKDPKEAAPSISHSIDLSYMLWREASWVGLSSWSGNSSHGSSIYSWNFTEKSKLCTCTIPVYSALMLSSFRHSYD
ncbi:uncharacterized protein LOC122005348 [Zingiber officinale]|uniref:uncharacterized protein LOC122005348 n=1 Tax=Zingiber officinale TaxID=94328 RepID=UPI001C4DBE80|nr:uncharacterized protein LOC122005348 [Zingiber officinale]